MIDKKKDDYLFILRRIAQKGFAEVLQYVNKKEVIHYNDILQYAVGENIIKSRSSVTIILNGLTEMGFLTRTVSNARPIRTTYSVSKKGQHVLKGIRAFEKEVSSN